nr:IPT/TIG domain-containing protein [Pedococcus sp. 5OH_020]
MRRAIVAALACLVGLVGVEGGAVPAAAATRPVVTAVSPTSGSTNGGTRVTVTGRAFSHVRGVQFGTVAGTLVRVLSSTKLQVTSPRHAVGRIDVRVLTTAGRSALVTADRFTFFAPPRVAAVAPMSGPTGGGTRVTVTGTGFRRVTAVRFGTSAGTAVSVLSTTKLLVTAPAHTLAAVHVRVSGAYGTSPAVAADVFTFFTPPRVTAVAPTSGPTGGGTRVTVTGTGFRRVTAVRFGTSAGTAVSVLSTTKLLVTAPAHALGAVHGRVSGAYGTSSAATADVFTYLAPPATAPPGSYTGSDGQSRPLTFFVSAPGTALQDVSVPTVDLACVPDGAAAFDKIQIASIALNADGSFASTTTQSGVFAGHPATFTYVFNGHLAGATTGGAQKLAGTLRESISYTDTPARDCTSNDQAWNATRDTQPAQPTTAPPSGSYTGADTQSRPLTFFVSAPGTALQDVSVPTVDLACVPDGAAAFDKIQIASIALNADGSFASTTTQSGVFAGHPATFTYRFNGNVHGLSPSGLPRLAGTLRESISYTDTPARDCTSNDQAWNATKS